METPSKSSEINGKEYSGKIKDKLRDCFEYSVPLTQYTENNYVMYDNFQPWYPKYKNFKTFDTDVWVVSFPKAGTTWTQEMVWNLLNNLDFEGEGKKILMKRFPYFEWDGVMPKDLTGIPELEPDDPCAPGVTWNILQSLKEPRTIKSHLHFELLPKDIMESNAKIIYVCRDPRDVCVSYFYHHIKFESYFGGFDDFVNFFLDDILFYGPFWKHVIDYWNVRHRNNVFFLRYEEMIEDLPKVIRRMAKFLQKKISDEDVEKLASHLSFESMKKNPAVNNEAITCYSTEKGKQIKFMRKGKSGDWNSHLSADQIQAFRKWTEMCLKDTNFPYYRN